MPDEPFININPAGHVNDLLKAVNGHLANLKNVLRTIEDGSFAERAQTAAPGTVVRIGVGYQSEELLICHAFPPWPSHELAIMWAEGIRARRALMNHEPSDCPRRQDERWVCEEHQDAMAPW